MERAAVGTPHVNVTLFQMCSDKVQSAVGEVFKQQLREAWLESFRFLALPVWFWLPGLK